MNVTRDGNTWAKKEHSVVSLCKVMCFQLTLYRPLYDPAYAK